MSRIGRRPVEIPAGVKVKLAAGTVEVAGPKGALTLPVRAEVKVRQDGSRLVVERAGESKLAHALHGTVRAHLANMMAGVTAGFEKTLEISGAGFGAALKGQMLQITLGLTHVVERPVPKGLTVEVPAATAIVVKGPDKHQVGQFAAELRALRPADNYKLKGIKYRGEVVRKKAGKTAVGVAK